MAVRIEKNGAVWTVIHDRPEARNAMDPKSADELTAAFLEFDADKDAAVAVFYGAGGAFCAGWDLKYVEHARRSAIRSANSIFPLAGRAAMAAKSRADRWDLAARAGQAGNRCNRRAGRCRRHGAGPVVRFPRDGRGAYFGVYCRRWGVPLIDGGTVRLPRIVGQGRALEIILTGRKVPAEESLRIGLCEYVTPKGGHAQRRRSWRRRLRGFRKCASARTGAQRSRAMA